MMLFYCLDDGFGLAHRRSSLLEFFSSSFFFPTTKPRDGKEFKRCTQASVDEFA